MMILLACTAGFVLDFLFGDPTWLYHPVRMMGALIDFLEKRLRPFCKTSSRRQMVCGGVLCGLVILISTGLPIILLSLAGKVHPLLQFALETFWCYQLLAAKSLCRESRKVAVELEKDDLPGARIAVSMIVGRDTQRLDKEGVVKAAVETVAENTSDGVVAPLLFMLLGGAPLGFFYKAVNTMDSMIGYQNEKYLYFGRAAAKLDDLCNYLPARISGLLMVASAFLLGFDGKNAYCIFKRDRYKHASPNSAQTEAACAGALDVQLAGDAWYFGELHKKEFIGDALRSVEIKDISNSHKLMYGTAVLALLIFGGIRLLLGWTGGYL